MAETLAPSGGLLCVALIDEEFIDRDALIAEAHAQLEVVATEAGVRVTGPSTWRFVDAHQVDGWQWWHGQLLIATVPAESSPAAVGNEPSGCRR